MVLSRHFILYYAVDEPVMSGALQAGFFKHDERGEISVFLFVSDQAQNSCMWGRVCPGLVSVYIAFFIGFIGKVDPKIVESQILKSGRLLCCCFSLLV